MSWGAYRADVILRESVVVGLVGAGGLGVVLLESLSSFAWGEVSRSWWFTQASPWWVNNWLICIAAVCSAVRYRGRGARANWLNQRGHLCRHGIDGLASR